MKRNTRIVTWVLVVMAVLAAGGWMMLGDRKNPQQPKQTGQLPTTVVSAPKDQITNIEVQPKETYSTLMENAGVGGKMANAIYTASKDVYDLANIRAGKSVTLISSPNAAPGMIKELVYPISADEELHVKLAGDTWTATKEAIAYEIKLRTVNGKVDSSLYVAGLNAGADERAVIAFADVFEWTVDFAQDVRVGDTFSFIYEERYRDGKYVMPGRIMAAEYVNDGVSNKAFLFKNAAGDEAYYDAEGNSLHRMFLKAPVAFKYITSGFTQGMRYVSAFSTSTRHRAIDYAAPVGTPIRATAAGTVVSAGRNGMYGNFTSIRHNATYTTNYAHQSKIAVKKGQKVSQGQIIGYVGSTGFSTGPHLHYEMKKNGQLINPLKEVFPSTDPISEADRTGFMNIVGEWNGKLASE